MVEKKRKSSALARPSPKHCLFPVHDWFRSYTKKVQVKNFYFSRHCLFSAIQFSFRVWHCLWYKPIENGMRCSSLRTFPSSSRNLSGFNSSPPSQWLPCTWIWSTTVYLIVANTLQCMFTLKQIMVTLRISAKRGKTIVSFGRIIPATEMSLNDWLGARMVQVVPCDCVEQACWRDVAYPLHLHQCCL